MNRRSFLKSFAAGLAGIGTVGAATGSAAATEWKSMSHDMDMGIDGDPEDDFAVTIFEESDGYDIDAWVRAHLPEDDLDAGKYEEEVEVVVYPEIVTYSGTYYPDDPLVTVSQSVKHSGDEKTESESGFQRDHSFPHSPTGKFRIRMKTTTYYDSGYPWDQASDTETKYIDF